jgi:hypothetical protein
MYQSKSSTYDQEDNRHVNDVMNSAVLGSSPTIMSVLQSPATFAKNDPGDMEHGGLGASLATHQQNQQPPQHVLATSLENVVSPQASPQEDDDLMFGPLSLVCTSPISSLKTHAAAHLTPPFSLFITFTLVKPNTTQSPTELCAPIHPLIWHTLIYPPCTQDPENEFLDASDNMSFLTL